MKLQHLAAALLGCCTLGMMVSCNEMSQQIGDIVKDNIEGKARQLRDSQTWGKVIIHDYDDELGDALPSVCAIETEGMADIYFTQSDTVHVKAVANEKVLEAYDISIREGGTLSIRYSDKARNVGKMPAIYLYVSAPTLQQLAIAAAGDFHLTSPLTQNEDLAIAVSGAGDVDIENDIACGALAIAISGAGDIDLRHADCRNANIAVSGAGDVTMKKLKARDNVTLTISGAGDVDAKVRCQQFSMEASGAGDADINVKADVAKVAATGAGDVELEGKVRRLVRRKSGFSSLSTKKLAAEEIVSE